MDNVIALPGFFAPSSPNQQARLFSTLEGDGEIFLEERELDAPTPLYTVRVTKESGPHVLTALKLTTNHFVYREGTKVTLRWGTDDIQMDPGTYMLTVTDGRREVLRRSFTIGVHPSNPLVSE